jgi:ribose 5-phosphate isomerase B
MKVALGCDRIGYVLKETIKEHLAKNNVEYADFGCYELERCDYTVYARKVGEAVAAAKFDRGVLIDSSGVGMCIVANRIAGIQAAQLNEIYSARMTRRHNNANILCIGARITGPAVVLNSIDVWLATDFDGEPHLSQQKAAAEFQKKYYK